MHTQSALENFFVIVMKADSLILVWLGSLSFGLSLLHATNSMIFSDYINVLGNS